jgi:hypothetical protein
MKQRCRVVVKGIKAKEELGNLARVFKCARCWVATNTNLREHHS